MNADVERLRAHARELALTSFKGLSQAKSNILNQANASVLAQANSSPQAVLSLLS